MLITGGSGFIGTNLINYLLENYPEYKLKNLDMSFPRDESQKMFWDECDLKNKSFLFQNFGEFKPDYVIHLAAKASLNGNTIDDFPDNIIGTQNIVNCINQCQSVKKFLHTSTQYVFMPGELPTSETDFSPYTPYGASKAESEKIVRNANLKCNWVILRPTNIWGPWHSFFPHELWPLLSKRFYMHPGFKPIKKHYGYVGNSIRQIDKILHLNEESLLKKVYYITDTPIDNAEWMNSFSKALSGKEIRKIPRGIWKILALNGDLLRKVGVDFPVDSERYFRLTVDEKIPFQQTIDVTGFPSISLDQGVSICLEWLNEYHPSLIRI